MAKARSESGNAAPEKIARTVVDVILGEAAFRTNPRQRLEDMRAIASVIVNRARRLGVTPQEVVAGRHRSKKGFLRKQFDAYDKRLPSGAEEFRQLAEMALRDVVVAGPLNDATYYATPDRVENLPKGLRFSDQTAGHLFFDDPEMRNIVTGFEDWRELQPAFELAPRKQTPLYDAAPIAPSTPGAGLSMLAQSPVVGRTPADRFARGVAFWSNPARQSYLFDFAGVPVALPGNVPIPQPRPDNVAPERQPDPLSTRSVRDGSGRRSRSRGRRGVGGLLGDTVQAEPAPERFGRSIFDQPVAPALQAYPGELPPDLRESLMQMQPVRPGDFSWGAMRTLGPTPDIRPENMALESNPLYEALMPGQPYMQVGPVGAPRVMEMDEVSQLRKLATDPREWNKEQDEKRFRETVFADILAGIDPTRPDRPMPSGQPPRQTWSGAPELATARGIPSGFDGGAMSTTLPPSLLDEPSAVHGATGGVAAPKGDRLGGAAGLPGLGMRVPVPGRFMREPDPARFAPWPAAPAGLPPEVATIADRPIAGWPDEPFAARTIAPPAAEDAAGPTYRAPAATRHRRMAPRPEVEAPPTSPRLIGATLGAALLGLPGAIAGGLLGGQLGRDGGLLGGSLGPASPGERFNAGYGLAGIGHGMHGPRGATGFSLSNPGSFAVSRGPGQGYDLTSGKYGWREHYDDNGNFRGITYSGGPGGLLGGLSRAVGGLLGGGGGKGKSRSEKDRDGYGVGLF